MIVYYSLFLLLWSIAVLINIGVIKSDIPERNTNIDHVAQDENIKPNTPTVNSNIER